ncbi:MAG: J domain-containing protein [Acidimicrobiales bacterium]|nr:J domain-containing protein [Acidimicrobiales bacterium]
MSGVSTLYDRLGCTPDADASTLRSAYRELAKRYHPDANSNIDPGVMAGVNEAWKVLSDPSRRAAYDRTLIDLTVESRLTIDNSHVPPTPPEFQTRRDAWFAGIRVQIVRLTREAARSAALALSIKRGGHPRAVYDARIDTLVAYNINDTADRVKAARAAGAAPLDLGLASALVGLTRLAERTYADARLIGVSTGHQVLAELIDRTWDNLAHGLSHEVTTALGANPHLTRRLRDL